MAKRTSTKGQKTIYKTYIFVHIRATRNPLKIEGELRCSGRVGSFCSTSDTSRVNLVTNPVKSNELEKDRELLTISCPSLFDLRFSNYHVYPQKYLSTCIRSLLFVDILLSSLIFLIFPVPVLKQYTNFEILAGGPALDRKQKLFSVYSWLFLLSMIHFHLYFYVFRTILFSDRK